MLTFKISADHPESNTHDTRPDIVAYPTEIEVAKNAYTLSTSQKQKRSGATQGAEDSEISDTDKARIAWAWVELAVEVKPTYADAGFGFNGGAFLRQSDTGRKSRAQLVQYATEIMHRQHRTHAFMVLIAKDSARLLRWDRAGAIVSEPINLLKDPYSLLNFIYRFRQMTPEQRGHDPSATLASENKLKKFEAHIPTNKWFLKCKEDILSNSATFPIYQVRV
jgi:hypothetical protein